MTVTKWLVRLVFTGYAVLAAGQPVLAGSYLSGNVDAIGDHGRNGGLLMAVAMLAFLVALAHWLGGRGPAWPVAAVVVLFLLQGVQIGLGYEKTLAVHIPLGVTIVGLLVAMAVWAWTPRVGRRGWLWRRGDLAPVRQASGQVGVRL